MKRKIKNLDIRIRHIDFTFNVNWAVESKSSESYSETILSVKVEN